METLTVKEYSELKGCTVRYVRKLITAGKVKAVESPSDKGGHEGVCYSIPLSACSPDIIKKYNRLHKKDHPEPPGKPEKPSYLPESMEELRAKDREEVAFWIRVLKEWEDYCRSHPGRKTDLTAAFVADLKEAYPDRTFTIQMLYRKKKALKEFGPCALANSSGKHKNHKRAIPNEVFGIFEYYYLDESRKTVAECMRLTELELLRLGKDSLLPLASASTFGRDAISRIPEQVRKYFREGEKAFLDACMPYIKREYGDLASNDIWVCDNHTFDILVDGGGDKPVRLYLTAFMDVRSRKMMGWYVTDAPRSDATLQALRRGIERYGIPKRILSDNGREFLTHDIGGRGFRKSRQEEHYIPTILDRLQIEFRTAMVKNAKAKIIERAFREVKECFSRLLEGYTGGNILERPERLKNLEKKASNFTAYADFEHYVDVYLEGWYNYQASSGSGMGGKTRNDVYAANLYEQRTALPVDLNLMLMRNSRMVTFGRNGVTLRLYGTELQFWSEELWKSHFREKVYYRYNPDDLSEVRVYDGQDRFLGAARQLKEVSYFASKDEVAARMRDQRKLKRTIAAYKKEKGIEAEDALALVMAQAERNLELDERLTPKIITPVRAADIQDFPAYTEQVSGGEAIDWTAALERFQRAKRPDT